MAGHGGRRRLCGFLISFCWALPCSRAAGNAEKAKQIARFSYSVRMLLTCVVAILGFQLGALNGVATALALFFPRITISVMQLLGFYKPQPKEAPAA